ncbi:MAG TPA: hypothetical protein DF637_03510, partial [Rikenellaceae bacterium]|nr:hypothetical protein [Rikenellaceae bacterium]
WIVFLPVVPMPYCKGKQWPALHQTSSPKCLDYFNNLQAYLYFIERNNANNRLVRKFFQRVVNIIKNFGSCCIYLCFEQFYIV